MVYAKFSDDVHVFYVKPEITLSCQIWLKKIKIVRFSFELNTLFSISLKIKQLTLNNGRV